MNLTHEAEVHLVGNGSGRRRAGGRMLEGTGGSDSGSGARHISWSQARQRRAFLQVPISLIVAVYLVCSIVVGGAAANALHTRSLADLVPGRVSRVAAPRQGVPKAVAGAAKAHTKAKYLVFIVLDGGRADYFKLAKMPHVKALIDHGVWYSNAFDGILEAETPSGHTALATGSTPVQDGILGFQWAENDNTYTLFSPQVVRAGAIEHIMEARGVPTIAGLYKKRYPGSKVIALSGHKYYAADPLGGPDADAIMYYRGLRNGKYGPTAIPGHMPPAGILNDPSLTAPSTHLQLGEEDRYVTRLALATYAKLHQQVTLINYPDFDWPLGHVDGGILSPHKAATLMRVLDFDIAQIEEAYRHAGILKKTLFVITADHGMMPIHHFVPRSIFTDAVSQAGAVAPTIILNSGGYVWLTKAAEGEPVAANIVAAHDPNIQAVYYLSHQHGKSVYAPAPGQSVSASIEAGNQFLLRTLLNGHEPTVVALLTEYSSATDPADHWRADHGGASWQSQHIPLVISGPGIRQGVRISKPVVMTDIAPTVLHDLGVKPAGMTGHILPGALRHADGALWRVREEEIHQLTPLVRTYQSHD
ncbi:MAG: alkaline phosphatase family protein [Chloroflexota bacterium]